MDKQLLEVPINERQVTAAVLMSMLGLTVHNAVEFGLDSFIKPEFGWLPVLILEVALLILWVRKPSLRVAASAALLMLGILNLIVGWFEVIPFDFLPYDPEQSVSHYLVHAIYGALQIPLLWIIVQSLRQHD